MDVILVKLKMKKIYKFFLTVISILILLMIGLGIIYLSLDKIFKKDSDIDVSGGISINYINGKSFKVNEKDNIKIVVTNNEDKPNYFTIKILQVRGEGKYTLLKGDDIVIDGELHSIDEELIIDTSIDALKTENYTFIIKTLEEVTGTLNVRLQDTKPETFANLILDNNEYSNSTLTKVGIEAGIENEGLIKSSDDLGVSYYFRGNITNNYVSFSNALWRIVRINGDGTVRLVLNTITSSISSYYTDENKEFNYNSSNMHEYLENWYQENIINKEFIANNKYCSDIAYDDEGVYYAYARVATNHIPTLNCLGDSISNHIGLLSIDEVLLAGANLDNVNQSYYLYNKDIDNSWYTMSAAKGNTDYLNLFMVKANGSIDTTTNGNLYRGVRPVINLVKNIEMTGKGTIDEPYTLKIVE